MIRRSPRAVLMPRELALLLLLTTGCAAFPPIDPTQHPPEILARAADIEILRGSTHGYEPLHPVVWEHVSPRHVGHLLSASETATSRIEEHLKVLAAYMQADAIGPAVVKWSTSWFAPRSRGFWRRRMPSMEISAMAYKRYQPPDDRAANASVSE